MGSLWQKHYIGTSNDALRKQQCRKQIKKKIRKSIVNEAVKLISVLGVVTLTEAKDSVS